MIPRSSGILLHPTSLPGPYGVGDLGESAREFVDRLSEAGQTWWQILPLTPADHTGSPYSSNSAFAANATLIDPVALAERGWLDPEHLDQLKDEAECYPDDEFEVGPITALKDTLLRVAFERADEETRPAVDAWAANQAWLDEYALFMALKQRHDSANWREWPAEFVRRDADSLAAARTSEADEMAFVRFAQWLFDEQWTALRAHAAQRNVKIIGDVPIFPAMDSADVWAHRQFFKVDDDGAADIVAGVPPDYFSPTGQKWGNPVFDWDALAAADYAWWGARIERAMSLCDLVRIDHFRGFESYWEVPADAPDAVEGEWKTGPAHHFFDWVRGRFADVPFIAEDLGIITDAVTELRDAYDLPGMKILQFAFDGSPDHPFLPHTFPENCVAYTGTHDNDTAAGWWQLTDDLTRHHARTYLSHGDDGIIGRLVDVLWESPANLVLIPVQDLYELGAEARMNHPGTSTGNWSWRMTEDQLRLNERWTRLADLTRRTGR